MGDFGSLMIYNVYNDCHNSDSVNQLWEHILWQDYNAAGLSYSMWCGDFNRHHSMWDEEWNCHLFTAWAIEELVKLITLVADHDMYMVLPKDIPKVLAG